MNYEYMKELYLTLSVYGFMFAVCSLPITLPIFVWLCYRKVKWFDRMSEEINKIGKKK